MQKKKEYLPSFHSWCRRALGPIPSWPLPCFRIQLDRRPRIWFEVSRGEWVIFRQVHNRSAAMAGGREHSDRKATRFQCWSISDKMPVSYWEHLGQRKPSFLCRQMAFLLSEQPQSFFILIERGVDKRMDCSRSFQIFIS